MSIEVVNINHKLNLFTSYWDPKVVGELNNQHIKLVKLAGEFVWHRHEHEDEMFFVIKGVLQIDLRDKTLTIKEGAFVIIPKGTEHRPKAIEEVHVMLFEPVSTINIGDNEKSELSRKVLEKV